MRSVWQALVMAAVSVPAAFAQTAVAGAPPPHEAQAATGATTVRAYLHDVSRVESWSFFDPAASGGDPTYSTFSNRATLGVRVTSRKLDVDGAFQYAQLVGLSATQLGPGALGSGGFYFFSAEAPEAYQAYFKTLNLRVKDVVPGLSITAGRMGYSSGEESPAEDTFLAALRRRRIGSRLVGEFEWSVFQRSFDGARFDFDRTRWAANASVLFPTQGGYEESANPTISALKVMTASFTVKPSWLRGQSAQLFAYHYRDLRDAEARPDNAVLGPRRIDVSVATFGASSVGTFSLGTGGVDTVVWLAMQTGDWYGQSHRAFSVALEGGYRWNAAWQPWIRAGLVYASGDSNPLDRQHRTFFQMLPSIHRYSKSTTYALMNLGDTFAELSLQPHRRVSIRSELHRLALAEGRDLWYYGSGATSRTAPFFGFTTHPSGGGTRLGTILENSVDVSLTRVWSMNAYLGWMRGGNVVRRSFVDDRMVFLLIENALRF